MQLKNITDLKIAKQYIKELKKDNRNKNKTFKIFHSLSNINIQDIKNLNIENNQLKSKIHYLTNLTEKDLLSIKKDLYVKSLNIHIQQLENLLTKNNIDINEIL